MNLSVSIFFPPFLHSFSFFFDYFRCTQPSLIRKKKGIQPKLCTMEDFNLFENLHQNQKTLSILEALLLLS